MVVERQLMGAAGPTCNGQASRSKLQPLGGLMVLALVLWLLPGERVGSCHGHAPSSELAG